MAKSLRFMHENPAAAVDELVAAVFHDNALRLTIGIDPGMTGALAFITSDPSIEPLIVDMPVNKTQSQSKSKGARKEVTRTSYNYRDLAGYFGSVGTVNSQTLMCVERGQPRPLDTAKTAFSIGLGYGAFPAFFAAWEFSYEEAMPVVWKRTFGLLGKDKSFSVQLASRLFPKVGKYFAIQGDHNRAEALLLALWCQRRRFPWRYGPGIRR